MKSRVDKKLEVRISRVEFYKKSSVDKKLEIRNLRAEFCGREFYEKSRKIRKFDRRKISALTIKKIDLQFLI